MRNTKSVVRRRPLGEQSGQRAASVRRSRPLAGVYACSATRRGARLRARRRPSLRTPECSRVGAAIASPRRRGPARAVHLVARTGFRPSGRCGAAARSRPDNTTGSWRAPRRLRGARVRRSCQWRRATSDDGVDDDGHPRRAEPRMQPGEPAGQQTIAGERVEAARRTERVTAQESKHRDAAADEHHGPAQRSQHAGRDLGQWRVTERSERWSQHGKCDEVQQQVEQRRESERKKTPLEARCGRDRGSLRWAPGRFRYLQTRRSR
jgi:hypothetical protein